MEIGGFPMPADSVERRAERVPIEVEIDFRRPGDHRYRVQLLDFSALGCCIEAPVKVSLDDIIWISLPGLESIQGYVCWVDGWIAGVEFERPLYPSVFEAVRDRLGAEPFPETI